MKQDCKFHVFQFSHIAIVTILLATFFSPKEILLKNKKGKKIQKIVTCWQV
jgi:hypothetical protein